MTDPAVTTGRSDHVHDLLSGYLNSDLEDAERLTVEGHLEECETCRADLFSLRLTVAALRQLPAAFRPRDFSIAPTTLRRPTPISRLPIWSGALAAVLAVVLGARLLSPPAPAPPFAAPAASQSRPFAPVPAAAPPVGLAASAPAPTAPRQVAAGPTAAERTSSNSGGIPAAAVAPPVGVPSPPNAAGPYPAAKSGAASTGSSGSYPAPVAPPQSSSSAESYPPPVSGNPAVPSAPGDANYPAPRSAFEAPTSVAPTALPTSIQLELPGRESTWFTPALGILGGLVLATAVVFWVFGRRSP